MSGWVFVCLYVICVFVYMSAFYLIFVYPKRNKCINMFTYAVTGCLGLTACMCLHRCIYVEIKDVKYAHILIAYKIHVYICVYVSEYVYASVYLLMKKNKDQLMIQLVPIVALQNLRCISTIRYLCNLLEFDDRVVILQFVFRRP